ncbi:hypothetical protein AJ88_40210 [Mesorhizobium amorphae CCBAU 01583]|nr:hypothetical protein AJ88_40210 [Mesorhizobium amorphae CCBAU 01583]
MRTVLFLGKLAADHHGDDGFFRHLREINGIDHGTIAHDGGALADAEDLVQLVRDIDHRDAVAGKADDDLGQALEFARRQARCRLVHGDDPGAIEQRAGDLDNLPLRHLQAAERGCRIDRWVEGGKGFSGAAFLLAPGDKDAAAGQRMAEKHVLGDAEARHLLQFLMDHGDTGGARRDRVVQRHWLAVDQHASRCRPVDPRQDAQQRRLAGAVLAKQAMDLAGADREGHVVEGPHGRKQLGDTCELQPG